MMRLLYVKFHTDLLEEQHFVIFRCAFLKNEKCWLFVVGGSLMLCPCLIDPGHLKQYTIDFIK